MKKIVIIGAGPAGLSAAYRMLGSNNDYSVTIIEQDKQAGGISKTVCHNGNRMDLGGHRFFSKDKQINDIWLEILQLQGKPVSENLEKKQRDEYPGTADPKVSDDVMLIRNRVSRIFYNGKLFDYPISVNADTLKKLGIAKSFQCFFGYVYASIFRRKETSLEDFYINRFGKPLYEMFFRDYTEKLWGVSPDMLSSSWGAQRVKGISISSIISECFRKMFFPHRKTNHTSLIEEFYYPKYGPGQLWEKMAEKIENMGGKILYNTTCTKISTDENSVKGVYFKGTSGEESYMECDYLLSSMPVKDMVDAFDTTVPEEVRQISQNLPYRDFITVGILFNKPKKTESKGTIFEDMPSDCWIYVQDSSVRMGRIQIFNNWSPFLAKNNTDTVWLGLEYFCSDKDDFWNMSDEEIANAALDELEKMKVIGREAFLDKTVIRQKKAYPAYFGSYESFDKVREYLDGFENLICIGRNGQHRYNNMDHSMMTGIEAAALVEKGVTQDKSAVWNVNTEKVYHESGDKS